MSKFLKRIPLDSEHKTARFAQAVAAHARSDDVFFLQGPLGSGKTTFARCFVSALVEGVPQVPSPTFTLLHSYKAPRFCIHHYDLYRLQQAQELEEIGLYDNIQGNVSLIEWPEIIPGSPSMPTHRLIFECAQEERAVLCEGFPSPFFENFEKENL